MLHYIGTNIFHGPTSSPVQCTNAQTHSFHQSSEQLKYGCTCGSGIGLRKALGVSALHFVMSSKRRNAPRYSSRMLHYVLRAETYNMDEPKLWKVLLQSVK